MPTFGDGMEDYSARTQDPNYAIHLQSVRRQPDQIPTWAQSPQYPEISSVYNIQQASMYPSQTYNSFRGGQPLPSIHDAQTRAEKLPNGIDPNRSMGMSSYSSLPAYSQPSVTRMDIQSGAFDARRGSYYDQTQRQPQNYPPAARHNGSAVEYQNQYQQRYDPYRQNAYSGSYAEIEYQAQPTSISQSANFNMVGETADSRGKRRRGNLPKPVTDILRAWFHEHLDHPYPTEEDKQQFMQRTGLTLNQVSRMCQCVSGLPN